MEVSKVIKEVIISCKDKNEAFTIGERLHEQLRGNKDYIENNIILNCTDYGNFIKLYIFEECKDIPILSLNLNMEETDNEKDN